MNHCCLGLKSQTQALLEILQNNPYSPTYEKLAGNLAGYYFHRIDSQHCLVYKVLETEKIIRNLKMWSCYE